jgi:hypothetical protein
MNKISKIIDEEIVKYYGDCYYDEYSSSSPTGAEVCKLRQLILDCIERINKE